MRDLVIVTPTLAVSPWLVETVASVASFEVKHVLVAPASRIDELVRRFPSTMVIAEPVGGMYAAINTALASVKEWEAFTYINDDDLLLPGFADVMRAVARNGTGALVAYGGVRLIDAHGRRLGAIPISPRPAINRHLYAQRIEPVYQHGTIVTRKAYEVCGGFDPEFRLCGDSAFLARACIAGVPFKCVTRREVAAFRLRAGQLTKSRQEMMAERDRVDAKLGLRSLPRTWAQRFARWQFRLANLPIYLERIARHGFISFDELIVRSGRG